MEQGKDHLAGGSLVPGLKPMWRGDGTGCSIQRCSQIVEHKGRFTKRLVGPVGRHALARRHELFPWTSLSGELA